MLLHSGKDAGLSGAFGIGQGGDSFGGGSLVERNLTRWTIFFAIMFVVNTLVLLKISEDTVASATEPGGFRGPVAGLRARRLRRWPAAVAMRTRARPRSPRASRSASAATLTWAVADEVASVDPLTAETRAEQLLTRQIHEPLIEDLAGPFGETRQVPGLALRARPSGDGDDLDLRLRRGVSFQDGDPFNADAVVVNAERGRRPARGASSCPTSPAPLLRDSTWCG